MGEWVNGSELNASTPALLVKALLDSLAQNHIINSKRIYLGGLSLGGMGTYDLLIRYPGYFAAAFPICGACNSQQFLAKASPTPLWIFHGAIDSSVLPDLDRALYKELINKGATRVTYTEYPNVKHNSWDNAFAEPELLQWIYGNKKKKNATQW